MESCPIIFFSNRKRLGKKLIYFSEIDSTNRWLKEEKNRLNLPHGSVVFTGNQIKGKGRFSRVWKHTPGNLAFSLLFTDAEDLLNLPFTLLLGISLQRFLLNRFQIEAKIKWPNDVLVNQSKISGILCESTFQKDRAVLICGIGFNLFKAQNDQESSSSIISLSEITNKKILPFSCLEWILDEIEAILIEVESGKLSEIIENWNSNSGMLNQRINYMLGGIEFSGLVKKLDLNGNLIVREEKSGDIVSLSSGEVTLSTNKNSLQKSVTGQGET